MTEAEADIESYQTLEDLLFVRLSLVLDVLNQIQPLSLVQLTARLGQAV